MRRLIAVSIALLGLAACSSSPGTTTPGGASSVATVTVTPGTASLAVAQTVQLAATAKDSAGCGVGPTKYYQGHIVRECSRKLLG